MNSYITFGVLLIQNVNKLVAPVACRQSYPRAWATEIMNFLFTNFHMEARTNELRPFTDLASEMLSHLLIASMALHPLI